MVPEKMSVSLGIRFKCCFSSCSFAHVGLRPGVTNAHKEIRSRGPIIQTFGGSLTFIIPIQFKT